MFPIWFLLSTRPKNVCRHLPVSRFFLENCPPILMILPLKHCDFNHSYVKIPEGIYIYITIVPATLHSLSHYVYIYIYIYIYSSLVLHIHYLTQCQYPIEIHYLNQLHPMNILQSYPLVQSAQLRRFPHFSQLELHFIPIRDLGLACRRAACLKNLMKNHQGWINIWGLNWFNQKKSDFMKLTS